MGTMIFSLPPQLPAEVLADLERASVAGGQDNMPFPTQVIVDDDQLIVVRHVDESGNLVTPWQVPNTGQVMTGSGTLMERLVPYQLPIELARGKLNQLRGQAFDWRMGGLCMPMDLEKEIHQATLAFGHALAQVPDPAAIQNAQQSLMQSFRAANQLVETYIDQVFQIRHERFEKLDTAFGCRLGAIPTQPNNLNHLLQTFNTLCLAFPWRTIEPEPSHYDWTQQDALVDWAQAQGLRLVGGPLLDFSGAGLPGWLKSREPDLGSLCSFLCDHVETVLSRYRDRVRQWHLIAASNVIGGVANSDDELLWLTVRVAEAARHVDPTLELVIGLAQPWGDYLASQDRTHSPFVFADTLLRTGIRLAALELEMIMGVLPRGSYCRDLLETSRILDLFALLGTPLQLTLAYPSAVGVDPLAEQGWHPAGHWHNGFSLDAQAEWAKQFAALAVCKPYVRAVHWAHFTDELPHLLPHGGLIDAVGQTKPAMKPLGELRQRHLK